MRTKAVLSLSGGLDSTTLLAWMLKEMKFDVVPVSFNYGSKHGEYELDAAKKIVTHYGLLCPWYIFDLKDVFTFFKSNLLRGGGLIPEGHYEAESMKQTVVPGRNLIFASVLTGLAQTIGASVVALGVHAGDHAIYPDCRPNFIQHLRATVEEATEGQVSVITPFLQWSKIDIVAQGLRLKVPYQLTRTCYKEQDVACGRCGSCVERREAFVKNHAIDPIAYEESR